MLIRYANHAESKADFYPQDEYRAEAIETLYCLDLLYQGEYIDEQHLSLISSDSGELIKLLTAIIKISNGSKAL